MVIRQLSHLPAFEAICCQIPARLGLSAFACESEPNVRIRKQTKLMILRNTLPGPLELFAFSTTGSYGLFDADTFGSRPTGK